jgi:hypothetical protein
LSGTWTLFFLEFPRPHIGQLSLNITKQDPSGNFSGTMNFLGSSFCYMKDEPVSGYLDDGKLVITGPMREVTPAIRCRWAIFILTRKGNVWEGELPWPTYKSKVYLAPDI